MSGLNVRERDISEFQVPKSLINNLSGTQYLRHLNQPSSNEWANTLSHDNSQSTLLWRLLRIFCIQNAWLQMAPTVK